MGRTEGCTSCSCNFNEITAARRAPADYGLRMNPPAVRSPQSAIDSKEVNSMAHSLELEGETELRLRNAGDGRLFAVVDGEAVSVRLRQCFPWSEPHRHLSLRDEDDEEVALVEDPATLTPESRTALEQALAEAGFVLEVTRVIAIDEEVEI